MLNMKDYFKVIKHKDDYWPVNVTCRRFFPPKKEDEEDNAGHSVFGNQNGVADAGRTQTGSADQAVGGNPVMLEVALQVVRKGLVLSRSLLTMTLAMLVTKMLH